jgi:hypothetical protein
MSNTQSTGTEESVRITARHSTDDHQWSDSVFFTILRVAGQVPESARVAKQGPRHARSGDNTPAVS